MKNPACKADPLLDALPEGSIFLADKAYDSDAIRETVEARGGFANIPGKSNSAKSFTFSPFLYRYRNLVDYFGDLTHYTKGYLQALLAEAADTPSLAVEQQPPPKGKEYVHSMMYWLVIKNHLLMIQSRSLASKQLEEYLTWLLKDRTTAIGPTGQVILQVDFDAAKVGGDLDDIKEIIVGGKAASAAIMDEMRSPDWLKFKNPAAPAVKREAEEDWG